LAGDLNEWFGEFERLSEAGRYFFSANRHIFKASKSAPQTGEMTALGTFQI
jgi:arsenite methyltransferase